MHLGDARDEFELRLVRDEVAGKHHPLVLGRFPPGSHSGSSALASGSVPKPPKPSGFTCNIAAGRPRTGRRQRIDLPMSPEEAPEARISS